MMSSSHLSSSSVLASLFSPRSIAVVGASDSVTKIGGIPLDYLQRFGYEGDIFPVNPRSATVQGRRAFASLAAIDASVDLAIVAVPRALLPAVIDDAAEARVRSMVLFSSGFAEVGEEGRRAQEALGERAVQAGIRLIGPNCLGYMNVASKVYATFSPAPGVGLVQAGRIGLVSQSGAFGAYAYSMARARGVGLSKWITTGNEADIQVADCIAMLAEDEDTDVIMAYMEGCRDGERLKQALAKAQLCSKPVVMIKVGSTDLGAQAAASHTAALAGDDAVYNAVFRKYGVLRANSLAEFFNLAHGVAVAGRPTNRSIGLLTVSGGVGALMADDCERHGMDVTALSEVAQDTIREWVPFAAPRNPVDITGQVTNDMALLEKSAHLMMEDRAFGSWVGFMAAAGAAPAFWPILKQLVSSLRSAYPDRLLAVCTLLTPEKRAELERLHCLAFDDPSECIRTISILAQGVEKAVGIDTGRQPPRFDLPPSAINEAEAMDLLERAGIPVVERRVVTSSDAAARAASELGTPVVVKVLSADIAHKSDCGGVALGIVDAQAAGEAYERVCTYAKSVHSEARIQGALVAQMLRGGVECIAGVHRDPVFGPVLMFGMGGIYAETMRDVAFRVLPVAQSEVREMLTELQSFPILQGTRGQVGVDLDGLVSALCALADFAMGAGDAISSVEINPLIARPANLGGCVALDALIVRS